MALSLSQTDGGEDGGQVIPIRPGSSLLPAQSATFANAKLAVPLNTVARDFGLQPCAESSTGASVCQATPSVVASAHVLLRNAFSFVGGDAVIGQLLHTRVVDYATQTPVAALAPANQTLLDFVISFDTTNSYQLVPNAAQDASGRRRVAACVRWNGSAWVTPGCELLAQYVSNSLARVQCGCNASGPGQWFSLLDAPAGCDNVPYSATLLDGCRVCGGDNSTCRGCDGQVASGKRVDGCNVCGGDNSSCAGCDGVPNSGAVSDWCGVCNGGNASCVGCDGVPVHPYTQARTQVRPKTVDACGVCGGCGASCARCDGVPNSGRLWDKCGKCGPYPAPAGEGQYSTASINNCSAATAQCSKDALYPLCATLPCVRDDCLACISMSNLSTANAGCTGCDGLSKLYSRLFATKVVDQCGLCGGNDCSCKDCLNVTNGPARRDRCGVCNGNNACLDCAGVPYGTSVRDVCNICNGRND